MATEKMENQATKEMAEQLKKDLAANGSGNLSNLSDDQVRANLTAILGDQNQVEAVMRNRAAGLATTSYVINGKCYTRQFLESNGLDVQQYTPTAAKVDTSTTTKGGIFDNIPDWLVTAAKIILGIVVVVGLVLVVKNFVLPKFIGDKTVEYNGAEIDDVEVM